MDKYLAVPFSVDDVYEGFAELDGLMRIEPDRLILDYQTKDAILGVVKSGLKSLNIQLNEILNLEFKKGFFSSKITITTNKFIEDKVFPKAQGNELSIKIKNKHKETAMQIISIANSRKAEIRLNEAESL